MYYYHADSFSPLLVPFPLLFGFGATLLILPYVIAHVSYLTTQGYYPMCKNKCITDRQANNEFHTKNETLNFLNRRTNQ
jgi:hypothetical protein